MKVSVATNNLAKVSAVGRALAETFGDKVIEIKQLNMQLDLPEQPLSDAIAAGAATRAQAALSHSDADLGIGIEAGLMQLPGTQHWMSVQVCVLAHRDGRQAIGMGPGFELPQPILDAVLAGEPLRKAFERLLDAKDSDRRGAIFFLSDGLLDREELTLQAVRMALLPWMRNDMG
ncbi:DUF84 family protein [Candidatus Bipolaricaulota bacterium]|nr:DUF84 family protein [Candidatus Bipolaricaulota bacterium]